MAKRLFGVYLILGVDRNVLEIDACLKPRGYKMTINRLYLSRRRFFNRGHRCRRLERVSWPS